LFVLDWLTLFAHAFRESRILVISFCNLIAGTLSEPPEVNGWTPQCYQALSSMHRKKKWAWGQG